MITGEGRGPISDGEVEYYIGRRKYPPTPHKRYRGINWNGDYFSENYSQYLCFSVRFSTNRLVSDRNSHLWSNAQQQMHDLIKSLHDAGMGYRKIAKHLNGLGIKTIRGNEWGSANVHSVLKRNIERLKRLNIGDQETEIEYGKMELVWLRERESYFGPQGKQIDQKNI